MLTGTRYWFILYFICSTALVFGQKPTASETELRKQADKHFSNSNYVDAAPLYSQLLSLFPHDPLLNFRYGLSLMESGKEKTPAIVYLEFATKNPPVPEDAWLYLGKAYMVANNYSKATDAFTKYKSIAQPAKSKHAEIDLLLSNSRNAVEVSKTRKDVAILNSREVKRSNFYTAYDFSETAGKLVPTAQQFLTTQDRDKQLNPLMFITKDGQSIYYSSYGKGSSTGKDIYHVRKMVNGQWGIPENLGLPVNTAEHEDFAYLDRDGKTLYFCSRGHNSIGGYDIFKSVFDYSANQWSASQNLGIPINTTDDDFFFVPTLTGDKAIYSTAYESSYGNVSIRQINLEGVSNRFAIISGTYFSLDQATRRDARISVLRTSDNAIVNSVRTDPKSGKYELVLPPGNDYTLIVEGGSYLPHAEQFSLPDLAVAGMRQEVKLNKDKEREQMTVSNFFTPVSSKQDEPVLAFRDTPTDVSTSSIYNAGQDSSQLIPVQIDDKVVYINNPKQNKRQEESLIPAQAQNVANYGFNENINEDETTNDDGDLAQKGKPSINLEERDRYDPTLEKGLSDDEIRQSEEEKERTQIVEEEEKNPSVLIDFNIDNDELAQIALEDAKSLQEESERMKEHAARLKTNAALQDSLALTLEEEAESLDKSEGERKEELKTRANELKEESFTLSRQASDLQLQASIKMDESRAAKTDAEAILRNSGRSTALAANTEKKSVQKPAVIKTQPIKIEQGTQDNLDTATEENKIDKIQAGKSDKEVANLKVQSDPNTEIENSGEKNKQPESISTDSKGSDSLEFTAIQNIQTISAEEVKQVEAKELKKSDGGINEITSEQTKSAINLSRDNSTDRAISKDLDKDTGDKDQTNVSPKSNLPESSDELAVNLKTDSITSDPNLVNQEQGKTEDQSIATTLQTDQRTETDIDQPGITETNPSITTDPNGLLSEKTAITSQTVESITTTEGNDETKKLIDQITAEDKISEDEIQQSTSAGSEISQGGNGLTVTDNPTLTENKNVEDQVTAAFNEPEKNLTQSQTKVEPVLQSENTKQFTNAPNTKPSGSISNTAREKYIISQTQRQQLEPEAKIVYESYEKNIQISETLFKQSRTLQDRIIEMPRSPERDSLLQVSNALSRESGSQYNVAQSQLEDAMQLDSNLSAMLITSGEPISTEQTIALNTSTEVYTKSEIGEKSSEVTEADNLKDLEQEQVSSFETEQTKLINKNDSDNGNQPDQKILNSKIAPSTSNTGTKIKKSNEANPGEPLRRAGEEENLQVSSDPEPESGIKQNESNEIASKTETESEIVDQESRSAESKQVESTVKAGKPTEETTTESSPVLSEALPIQKDRDGVNVNHPKYPDYQQVQKEITDKQVETINLFAEGVNLNKKSVEEKQQQVNLMDSAQATEDKTIREELLQQAEILRIESEKNQELSREKLTASQAKTHEVKALTSEMETLKQEIALQPLTVASPVTDKKTVSSDSEQSNLTQENQQNVPEKLTLATKSTSEKTNMTVSSITSVKSSVRIAPEELERLSIEMYSVKRGPAYTSVNPIPLNPGLPEGLVFKVQVGAFRKPIPDNSFKNLQPVSAETSRPGWIRYCVGVFKTFEPANLVKKELRSTGYKDAFVVAYFNGQRVSLQEANALLNRQENQTAYAGEMQREITALRQLNVIPSIAKTSPRDEDEKMFYGNTSAPVINAVEELRIPEYSVQIGVYRNSTPPAVLSSLEPIYSEALSKGLYRFTSGRYTDRSEAEIAKNKAIQTGVSDAFVVVIRGSNFVTVPQVIAKKSEDSPATVSENVVSKAEEKVTPASGITEIPTGLHFKVQLGAFRQNVPFETVEAFLKISDKGIIRITDERGLNIFYAGDFDNFEAARLLKDEIIEKGVEDAFVVVLSNGKRIPLSSVLPKE